MNPQVAESARRTRWRCRRGLLELDILFTRFLDEQYSSLSALEQFSFQKLLEQSDVTLLAWIQGRQPPPPHLKLIFHKLIQYIDY